MPRLDDMLVLDQTIGMNKGIASDLQLSAHLFSTATPTVHVQIPDLNFTDIAEMFGSTEAPAAVPPPRRLAVMSPSTAMSKLQVKSPRDTMSNPQISLIKLHYIFNAFSNPMTQQMDASQMLELLKKHRIKQTAPFSMAIAEQRVPLNLFGPDAKETITLEKC